MLSLDDLKWQELTSNYTSGFHVAELLSQAYAAEPVDKWYDPLFQELLHQYTLSQSAYAAVPHLVQIARDKPEYRKHLLVLIG